MSDEVTSTDCSKELAQIAQSMQSERTGHTPKAVTVVASEDTVVLTLHEALTPAEKILASSENGLRRSSSTIGPFSRCRVTSCEKRFSG